MAVRARMGTPINVKIIPKSILNEFIRIHTWKERFQCSQFPIRRSEVVAPLRHTMSLVHGNAGDVVHVDAGGDDVTVLGDVLGRHVQDVQLLVTQLGQYLHGSRSSHKSEDN